MRRGKGAGRRLPLAKRGPVVSALLAAGLMGMAVRPAMADTTSSTAVPTTDESNARQLPPVSVTSQRAHGFAPASVETGPYRGMDVLDVPATVNVVTRSLMDAQGDTGLFDALRNVAG
jgi:iron complex outermembrane receptor protein